MINSRLENPSTTEDLCNINVQFWTTLHPGTPLSFLIKQ